MARPVMSTAPEFADIQGIARFGYRRLTAACFYLLEIADAAAARDWLLRAPVTDAKERDPPPETALQVALSAVGLRALGIPDDIIAGFSTEFLAGMAGEANRSHRLGDVGGSDPMRWQWGGPGATPHVLVMIYAVPKRFETWQREVTDSTFNGAFRVMRRLATTDLDGREPFGFVDGISQPTIDWERREQIDAIRLEYRNVAALGEFLLGYPNEYGKYTDRPLLTPEADPFGLLPGAEEDSDHRDLGRNGTYLVMRDLSQDLAGFWEFLDRQRSDTGLTAEELAEAMVGRTIDGTPLVSLSGTLVAGVNGDDSASNNFTFSDDPDGKRCPLGAHIRRANPRNADMPGGPGGAISRLIRTAGFGRHGARDDLVAPVRFHRILRRGRPYGPASSPQRVPPSGADEERGIHFICLNANIARQFEFVQNAWMVGTKFDGLIDEGDPLLGNRQPVPGCPAADGFTYARDGAVRRRLVGLPQFVTVRGGAYFFLPGIRALRYLATGR
jgi:deferrochelatase/peroxidase EfeB